MPKADAIWNLGPDLIDDDGEVRELTAENFRRGIPFADLPEEEKAVLRGLKHAAIRPDPTPEEEVTLKLSRPVLEKLRATGSGWEHTVDQVLREWLEKQKAS